MSAEQPEIEESKVWPPAPTGQPDDATPPSRRPFHWKVPALAVSGSFLAGIVDVFRTDHLAVCLYAAIAMLLGFIQPRAVFLISLIAAICYFFCHLVAIGIGFKPPYVEEDMSSALACFIVFFPTLAGGAVGALAKQLWRFAQVS